MSAAERITVLGGGAWGTALAVHAATHGARVSWWVREPDVVEEIRARRSNARFLPGVEVPAGIDVGGDPAAAVRGADLVLGVVPSRFARGVWEALRDALPPAADLVLATKGIEEESLELPGQVAASALRRDRPSVVLSGPTFAAELAARMPTAVVAASEDPALARRVQRCLSSEVLRVYTHEDPIGVQVAGALKNVIAIAAGVAEGLGMGHNAQAALITRGLVEIARLGAALGGRAETFSGLAGLGDLVLTATGDLSRNRTTGIRLGRGETLAEIRRGAVSVAEGVPTARSARALARRHGVEMPIVDEVHRILFEDGSPREAIGRLMGRPLRSETTPR